MKSLLSNNHRGVLSDNLYVVFCNFDRLDPEVLGGKNGDELGKMDYLNKKFWSNARAEDCRKLRRLLLLVFSMLAIQRLSLRSPPDSTKECLEFPTHPDLLVSFNSTKENWSYGRVGAPVTRHICSPTWLLHQSFKNRTTCDRLKNSFKDRTPFDIIGDLLDSTALH